LLLLVRELRSTEQLHGPSVRRDPSRAATALLAIGLGVLLAGCSASAGAHALPPELTERREPTVQVESRDVDTLVPGVVVPFALGHCGLFSPVSIDGSLWDPVLGADAQGGPIDTSDEIGELINPTSGEVVLVDRDRLDFRTPSGLVVVFERHDGPGDYPLCD
jgi:hypothetical protein